MSKRTMGVENGDSAFIRAFPSLESLSAGFSATSMPVVIADARALDLPVVYINAAFSRLTGYDATEVVGRNCRFLQGKGTDLQSIAKVRQSIETARPVAVDILNYRKDGSPFWNALSMAPINGSDGHPQYFFACQLDASARRQVLTELRQRADHLEGDLSKKAQALQSSVAELSVALAEKSLLVHELHHRVRNNLQLLSTLVTMQKQESGDTPADFVLAKLKYRVDALASVYRGLYDSSDVASFDVSHFLAEHVPSIAHAYSEHGVEVTIEAEPVRFDSRNASAIALLLNELLAGSVLAAAPVQCKLNVSISAEQSGRWARIILTVPAGGQGGELGKCDKKLVEALVRQLRGTVAIQSDERGKTIRLELPSLPMRGN